MIACLHPSDKFFDENISTLTYASKAAQISNTPVRNDDPKNKLIEEMKIQNRYLAQELQRANGYIAGLCQQYGIKGEIFGESTPTVVTSRDRSPMKGSGALRTIKSDQEVKFSF